MTLDQELRYTVAHPTQRHKLAFDSTARIILPFPQRRFIVGFVRLRDFRGGRMSTVISIVTLSVACVVALGAAKARADDAQHPTPVIAFVGCAHIHTPEF